VQSYFQRKKDLASIEAFVKSGMGPSGGRVFDLEKGDIKNIYTWYSGEKY
jgi:putative membrane protein